MLHTQKARELELSPDPYVIKFAKMLAHVLDQKTIFITDQAQLVGYTGSLPHTIAWDPSCASILNEEVNNDPTAIPDPIEKRPGNHPGCEQLLDRQIRPG